MFLELFVKAIKFLHLLDSQPVLLLGTDLTVAALLDDSLPGYLWGFVCCAYLVDNVWVDIVFEGGWVELFQPVLDLLLGSEFEEVLKPVPLVVVNIYG